MAAVGPFEARPAIAVAVSGGADSMALTLLARQWAAAQGGSITALTVDHGLRPGSAAEARQVARWMADLGIAHHTLAWPGTKAPSGIEAAARDARYDLLEGWCRGAGILHLLLAHHAGDQAETVVMRLMRGSGPDGLAAMVPIRERAHVRLLRPLLGVARERLRRVLLESGQAWLEDPTNHHGANLRARLRQAWPVLSSQSISATELSALAEATRRQREAIHGLVSALLARGCRVHPTGFARIDPAVFGAAPRPVAVRALARLIASIGGSPYPPAQDKVVRLCARVLDEAKPKAATLGRCRLIPSGDGKGGDGMLVCREVRGLPEPAMVTAAPAILWDGRFQLRFADRRKWEPTTLRLMALGQLGSSSDWRRRVAERQPKALLDSIPGAVLASMPALIDDEGVVHVPHLRPQSSCHAGQETRIAEVAFRPVLPLSAGGQFLV